MFFHNVPKFLRFEACVLASFISDTLDPHCVPSLPTYNIPVQVISITLELSNLKTHQQLCTNQYHEARLPLVYRGFMSFVLALF